MLTMNMNPGYFGRYAYTMNDPINLIDPDGQAGKGKLTDPDADLLKKAAEKRAIRNAKRRGRRKALNEEKRKLEDGTSELSEARQKELAETGQLKNMDFHHEQTVSSGTDLKEKIDIAENPGPNSRFMEKPDHIEYHKGKGSTQVPLDENGDVVTNISLGTAGILTAIGETPDPVSLIFDAMYGPPEGYECSFPKCTKIED